MTRVDAFPQKRQLAQSIDAQRIRDCPDKAAGTVSGSGMEVRTSCAVRRFQRSQARSAMFLRTGPHHVFPQLGMELNSSVNFSPAKFCTLDCARNVSCQASPKLRSGNRA